MKPTKFMDYDSPVKVINRNVLNTGTYTGITNHPASRILVLPGYDHAKGIGSKCVRQGIFTGAIKPDAKVFGVERDLNLIPLIYESAVEDDINLTLLHGDLVKLDVPENLDRAILDTMQIPTKSPYQYVHDKVVPMMNDNALITINMCIQSMFGKAGLDTDEFRDEFLSNPDEYVGPDTWDVMRPQDSIWSSSKILDYDLIPENMARSIAHGDGVRRRATTLMLEDEGCFLNFVGLHSLMKNTNFIYGGCYVYKQISSSMRMMTICYYRGNIADDYAVL